jgi:ribosome biogenesis protein BRX1
MGRKGQKKQETPVVAAEPVVETAEETEVEEAVADSKDVIPKQRVLILSSRGVSDKYRHLMIDLINLLPHSKKDAKFDSKSFLPVLNEACELKSCNSCIFFEVRKKRDLYLWFAKSPAGPSAKFHVTNVHTMDELKMMGNCLKGSRALLHFDAAFESEPYLQVLKEMFTHIFAVPKNHSKTKPFVDHIMCFYVLDGRIWFRHFQILLQDGTRKLEKPELVEIGPRFVMQTIRVFEGSFCGKTLYENAEFVSPNVQRQTDRMGEAQLHALRKKTENHRRKREEQLQMELDEMDTLFQDQD